MTRLINRFRLWRWRRRVNAFQMTLPAWWTCLSDDEKGEYISREIREHRATKR